jgi:prepilin-type N-terminal cleavage/methylation domain-containing protein
MIYLAIQTRERPHNKKAGFTLVEMAVVLVIISLLLGGLLLPLATQVDQQRRNETEKRLKEINEALIGFALSKPNPYLPCPDKTTNPGSGTANDGQEDRNPADGKCVSDEGNIPWTDLGITATDSWGTRFHYRVHEDFSNSTATFSLSTEGNILICPFDGCTSTTAIAKKIPAVVLSYGKNTFNPGSNDENENTDGDAKFVSRVQTPPDAAVGEFDDIVVWLSPNILFNRMVMAGKLP